VWDEGMAESAAAYLEANPGRRMVILCGAGHVEFGSGIPQRLERRTHETYAIVLNSGEGEDIEPHVADYLLLSKEQDLPPAGVLGVNLEGKSGECRVASVTPGGAGAKAGLRKGDAVVGIDAQVVKTVADARVALWDKKPGDRVRVEVRRKRRLGAGASLNFEFTLAAAPKPPETH
jgi:predicted metalloprotease with PDZ domain